MTNYSAIAEIAASHSENVIEADSVLREIVEANRRPTFPELTFFARELGWNEIVVNNQLRRMNSVLRLRAIAGSSADREATALEFETAAKLFDSEAPKLREKLAKLQTQLDGLERDSRLSLKRVEEQNEAVRQLKELTPEHVRESVRSEVSRIESSIGREILDGEVRVNELQACLDPSRYRNESEYLAALKRSFPDSITEIVEGRTLRRKLSPQWSTIREGIQAELAELMPHIETLRAQRAELIAAAELPLNYYAG